MDIKFIDAIPVPACVVSADDFIAGANAAFLNLLPNTQIGRSYLTILRQPALVSLVAGLRLDIQPDPIQLEIRGHTNGIFSASGATLRNGDVLICMQNRDETAVAIQMRQNFVADLSHELKTPLTAISGILETTEGDLDALTHFLPIMSNEVDHMKQLVDDLVTLSRVEANERRNPNQTIELQNIVAKACAPLAMLAKKMNIRIETTLPEDTIQFQGDQNEMVRAIMNLIENALRYGNSGGYVQVTAGINNEIIGASNVTIEVSDDGPGVESHHIPRLTERFYRVDAHRSRNTGGSGLGLAIVKHIVTHHRGQMKFESQPTIGSKVTLTLPVKQSGPNFAQK